MTIVEAQDSIIEIFEGLGDWLDKYEYITQLGREAETMDPGLRTEANTVSGCQSSVWITAELLNGRVQYHTDSDALITRGLIALLMKVFNNRAPKEIVDADLYFIYRIGLKANLSPSRSNGLASIVKNMKRIAGSLINE